MIKLPPKKETKPKVYPGSAARVSGASRRSSNQGGKAASTNKASGKK